MFVKICCIGSTGEAEMALGAGADALGLVSAMPSGPGVIDEALIRQISRFLSGVSAGVLKVLLTRETRLANVVDQVRYCETNAVQLVDFFADSYRTLKRRLGGAAVIQVVHVENDDGVARAVEVSAEVDMVLLDSGRPGATVAELGGTGRVHDWMLSKQIVAEAQCPVILAGGLHPRNVESAKRRVTPYGLDVCSGVRTDGILDPVQLQRFMSVAKGV
ncbi:MAG: phosphoribosylanthranilate isomerase [Gammaproteobacteria bacterium]|nr:phosphoribosylanthranilate isomerase [Gammaproteobacteria bacterium]